MAAASESPPPAPAAEAPRPRPLPHPVAYLILFIVCIAWFAVARLRGGGLDILTLICYGAKDRELILGAGEWWRLISAGFLHGHVAHLACNLYALYVLGPVIERLWGTPRFLIMYLGALVAGNVASLFATEGVSVGASGAVFGLFGALVVFSTVYRRFVRPEARMRLWVNLAVIAAINVGLGISLPFIDNAAHAGGFVGGALLALVLRPVPARGPSLLADLLARALSAAAVIFTIWALAEAAAYAWSSDVILTARARMEPHAFVEDGFGLFAPKGWEYEPPTKSSPFHVFRKAGVAVIAVHPVPRDETADLAAFARTVAHPWLERGAELLGDRDIAVAGQPARELLFRRSREHGEERIREVIFHSPPERLFQVTCFCAERSYRLLEIIFDKVIQSIAPVRTPVVGEAEFPRPQAPEAQELWRRVTANPGDADAYLPLAAFYRLEGRHDAAEQALKIAIRLQPRSADAHDQLAYLYATAPPPYRRPEQALTHARRALRLQPDTPRYLATLAIAHEAAGDRDKALEAARKAAALAPDDATYTDLVRRLSGAP